MGKTALLLWWLERAVSQKYTGAEQFLIGEIKIDDRAADQKLVQTETKNVFAADKPDRRSAFLYELWKAHQDGFVYDISFSKTDTDGSGKTIRLSLRIST